MTAVKWFPRTRTIGKTKFQHFSRSNMSFEGQCAWGGWRGGSLWAPLPPPSSRSNTHPECYVCVCVLGYVMCVGRGGGGSVVHSEARCKFPVATVANDKSGAFPRNTNLRFPDTSRLIPEPRKVRNVTVIELGVRAFSLIGHSITLANSFWQIYHINWMNNKIRTIIFK